MADCKRVNLVVDNPWKRIANEWRHKREGEMEHKTGQYLICGFFKCRQVYRQGRNGHSKWQAL